MLRRELESPSRRAHHETLGPTRVADHGCIDGGYGAHIGIGWYAYKRRVDTVWEAIEAPSGPRAVHRRWNVATWTCRAAGASGLGATSSAADEEQNNEKGQNDNDCFHLLHTHILIDEYNLFPRLKARLHLGQELINHLRLGRVKRAIPVNLFKHRHVLLGENHRLVLPMKQFKVAIIVRLVEFLLCLECPVLVHRVDKALDVGVLKLAQLVSPLGQREIDRLTLRGVLEWHRRKLDHLSVPDPMVRETLGGAGHVSSGHSRP